LVLECSNWQLSDIIEKVRIRHTQVEKQRINSRYKKRYDAPKTQYQRLLEPAHTDEATKNRLRNIHKGLNLFMLKQGIEKKFKRIFRQIKVTSSVRQRI
jgi:hypothetical protein